MLKVFAGYDPRVPQGFEVFRHSVERHASGPVAVIPLDQDKLRVQGVCTRPQDERASTPFSLTRFLIPSLCGFRGAAVFCDGSDMLMTRDVYELVGQTSLSCPVWCVQHDYHPRQAPKFFDQAQHDYPRKNWSSVMVFHCGECTNLNQGAANTLEPSSLHQLLWARQDRIGSLPLEWNWLAGEDEYRWDNFERPPALIHYTLGLPVVPGAIKTEFDNLWFSERQHLLDSIMVDPNLDHNAA